MIDRGTIGRIRPSSQYANGVSETVSEKRVLRRGRKRSAFVFGSRPCPVDLEDRVGESIGDSRLDCFHLERCRRAAARYILEGITRMDWFSVDRRWKPSSARGSSRNPARIAGYGGFAAASRLDPPIRIPEVPRSPFDQTVQEPSGISGVSWALQALCDISGDGPSKWGPRRRRTLASLVGAPVSSSLIQIVSAFCAS